MSCSHGYNTFVYDTCGARVCVCVCVLITIGTIICIRIIYYVYERARVCFSTELFVAFMNIINIRVAYDVCIIVLSGKRDNKEKRNVKESRVYC